MVLPLIALLAFATPSGAFQARMDAGRAALDRNDLRAAQSDFEQATQLEPENPAAWLLLAEAYAKQKTEHSAVAAAHKAEALGPEDPKILQGLANFYVGFVQDLPKAAALGARYAERSPNDKTAWRRVANLYLVIGRPAEAIASGTRGLILDNSAELHTILGTAYSQQKDWPKATAEFAEAVKLNPADEQTRFRLAQTYLKLQDFPAAVKVLESAQTEFPESPQIALALGVAYYGLRKFPEAVDQFLRTIKLAPDVPQPYVFLGRMMEHTAGRLAEVTQRFAEYQARNPRDYLGYLLHAKGLVAQLPSSGYPAQAETAYQLLEKSLSLKEDKAETHYLLGVLLDRKRDFAAAATHLERSIQLDANDSAAHYRLAKVYDRLGRREEAAQQRVMHEKLSEAEKETIRHEAPVAPPGQ